MQIVYCFGVEMKGMKSVLFAPNNKFGIQSGNKEKTTFNHPGIVSSRVALLLRSGEIKPWVF